MVRGDHLNRVGREMARFSGVSTPSCAASHFLAGSDRDEISDNILALDPTLPVPLPIDSLVIAFDTAIINHCLCVIEFEAFASLVKNSPKKGEDL
jgi:hypothetical protein